MRSLYRSCRSKYNSDVRPAVMHPLGKSQAIDSSRHIDVREEQLNVGVRLEQFERLVTVHRLDHPETGIFKHANRREANQRFIFNNENQGMMGSHDLATITA